MIYALIGYMWLFIHRPFEVWPALAAFRVERVYMLMTLVLWISQPKSWTANRINVGVGLLATSILVSAALSPYEGLGSIVVENWFKLALFYVLVMTSVRTITDLKMLLVAFVAILALYELHSLREYWCGRGVYRMGTWRMIGVDESMCDPNTFAASVIYGLPMLLPAFTLVAKTWQKRFLWGCFGLGVVCVLLTGSRTGFAALALGCVGLVLTTRHRWKIFAGLLIACPVVWLSLTEELQNRYLTLIDPSRGPAAAESSANLREEFFFMALDIWQQQPLFGVGPRGFAYASHTEMQSHSLYAETLSELGSLGVLAVIVLIVAFINNYREARKWYQVRTATPETRFCYYTVCATTITVLLLLFLGLGGHNLFRYTWLWYGSFSALSLRFLKEEVTCNAKNVGEWSPFDQDSSNQLSQSTQPNCESAVFVGAP